MFKSILVPLDGSANAESALPTAIAIARATSARINVLTVDVPVPVLSIGMSLMEVVAVGTAAPATGRYLERIARRIGALGVDAESLGVVEQSALFFGSIGGEIAHRAAVTTADAVVMTTHARSSVPRFFLGSVARDVVRSSSVPVVMIKPQRAGRMDLRSGRFFRRVVVPLDGSDICESVIDHVVTLSGRFAPEFILVSVISPPHVTGIPVDTRLLPVDEVELASTRKDRQSYLHGIADRLHRRGLRAITQIVVEASPAEGLARVVKELDPDVLAMTTHGRTAAGSLFLGSVANQMLRSVQTPVMLYRPSD